MGKLDPRLHAFRADLADGALRNQVTSARYVVGEDAVVLTATAPLRRDPSPGAALDSEALAGESVKVFDRTPEGWAWVQLAADGYVGWLPEDCLGASSGAMTHKVTALRTLVFRGPDIKQPVLTGLPLGARVNVSGEAEDRNARYGLIRPAGAVVMQHLAPLEQAETDFVQVAERFVGTPYLWGGKTSLGIDCSGLVQVATGACGIAAPRDSDMQEASLGELVGRGDALPALRRGDLVFWKGHVGIMLDGEALLHANATHMAVTSEPLAAAVERYAAKNVRVSSARRLPAAALA